MNKQQYTLGWQIACWSTLAITVCSVLTILTGVFGIIQAVAVGAVGFGFLTAANELVKEGQPAATEMKAAATTLFIIAGLYLLGKILGMTVAVDSLSGGKAILIFSGLLQIAAAIFVIMFKNKIVIALSHLNINNGLFGAGILVYAIGLIVVAFGVFIFGLAPSVGTLGMLGVFAILGGIAALVGAILWIIGMFQVTEKATK